MTKICVLTLLSILITAGTTASAEDLFGIEDDEGLFASDSASLQAGNGYQAATSSFLSNRIPESTARNLNKAEKVFCYTVDYTTAGYEGYTINDFALKGSCGELSQAGRDLIKNSVFENNSLYSTSKDNCSISPKIMLRYVYGADYTDVLFSSPCQSLTFFHGRDITTVNAAPGAEIIDQIVKAYESLEEPYKPPALLGQMVGNGQAMSQRDKEILRRSAPTEAPRKKWGNTQQQNNPQAPAANSQPAKTGWNRLR